jgi:hypothetical protein
MPWTPKQFRFLMSSGSPLTAAQKEKDKAEAHADPSMVHRKKGSRMASRFKEARR